MNKIFVFGSINMDLVFKISRLPELGETLRSDGFIMTPGGKGANQAVACARQGIETWMIGSVGDDAHSLICLDELIKSGVDCRHVKKIAGISCGVAGIFVESGNNRIVTVAGANAIHDSMDIENILIQNGKPRDYLISQLEVPLNMIIPTFRQARKQGIITVLNAAPARELPAEILELVDILVVNETEIANISGIRPLDDLSILESMKRIRSFGVKAVLLTLGANGSIFQDETMTLKQSSFKVETVDTTAAGDTYIGSFVASLVERKTIQQAMLYASAAAAMAIQTLGAGRSIPTAEMVKNFLINYKEER